MTANRETIWNLIMRFSPAAIALSLGLAMVSSAGLSKPELPPISAQASDRVVIHAPGTKVVILGCTQKIELNGRSGRVEEFDPESERYVIEMEGSIQGKRYEIRAANVAPHPHWRKKDKMDLHLQTYTQGMAVFDR